MWELFKNESNRGWESLGYYDDLDYVSAIVKHEIYLHNVTPEFQNNHLEFKIFSHIS